MRQMKALRQIWNREVYGWVGEILLFVTGLLVVIGVYLNSLVRVLRPGPDNFSTMVLILISVIGFWFWLIGAFFIFRRMIRGESTNLVLDFVNVILPFAVGMVQSLVPSPSSVPSGLYAAVLDWLAWSNFVIFLIVLGDLVYGIVSVVRYRINKSQPA